VLKCGSRILNNNTRHILFYQKKAETQRG
jgi:hypothetical protein